MKRIFLAIAFLVATVTPTLVHPAPAKAIIGGEEAAQYPWMVAFVEPNDGSPIETRIICSGVLIHPEWVLTAAHCTGLTSSTIVIGRQDLRSTANSETRTLKSGGGNNIRYGTDFPEGDIRILRLNSPSTHQPIKIAKSFHSSYWDPGDDVRSYGYGCTSLATPHIASRYLRRAEFRMVTLSPSGPYAVSHGLVAPLYFMARWDGRLICPRDSGGPTITSTHDGPRVVGINSYLASPWEANFYAKVGNRGTRENSPQFWWLYDRGLVQ